MRRVISLWLPTLPTDRLSRRRHGRRAAAPAEALVTVVASQGVQRIAAACATAQGLGIAPGLTLADARALNPQVRAHPADAAADARALAALADWCGRYTPWTAMARGGMGGDGPGGGGLGSDHGLFLDVSGCAHLFGGEGALLGDLVARVRGLGFACRAGLGPSPGAAWALARFAGEADEGGAIAPPDGAAEVLAGFPVRALRLSQATAEGLERVGLRRVGELYALPRGALARRFGEGLTRRLDEALGRVREPISPRRPVARWRERLALPEPIGQSEDIAAGLRHLLDGLCRRLERDHRGARRLDLALYLCDGEVRRVTIGTSRPAREPEHLFRLFAEHLDGLDLGPGVEVPGVEVMVLAAPVTDPLSALQLSLAPGRRRREGPAEADLGALVDRLGNRLGAANVVRLAPRASHVPERACRTVAPLEPAATAPWPDADTRPLRLFERAQEIEAVAEVPDGPPLLFRWRRVIHRVARAEGPERIAPEWWRAEALRDPASRDYYRVEDAEGRRFWLYRHGLYRPPGGGAQPAPRWYLHGVFG
jgi:protein ImuB